MTLREYFRVSNQSMKKFHERHLFPFSYGYLRLLACERRKPSLEVAVIIEKATRGKVKPKDFMDHGEINTSQGGVKSSKSFREIL